MDQHYPCNISLFCAYEIWTGWIYKEDGWVWRTIGPFNTDNRLPVRSQEFKFTLKLRGPRVMIITYKILYKYIHVTKILCKWNSGKRIFSKPLNSLRFQYSYYYDIFMILEYGLSMERRMHLDPSPPRIFWNL